MRWVELWLESGASQAGCLSEALGRLVALPVPRPHPDSCLGSFKDLGTTGLVVPGGADGLWGQWHFFCRCVGVFDAFSIIH